MNLHAKLLQRQAEGRPLRIGLIGAGKFGSMYLAQVPRTPGIHLVGIADLSPDNAKTNLERVGWNPERTTATSLDDALARGTTHVSPAVEPVPIGEVGRAIEQLRFAAKASQLFADGPCVVIRPSTPKAIAPPCE